MRMDFSPSGRNGQRDIVGSSSRVPMPIIRSVCGHSRYAAAIVKPKLMGVADDATAAAERHHRRVDQFGQFEDFIARVDGAAADEDHRRLAAGDQRRRGLNPFGIRLWRRERIERLCGGHVRALREHVPRHFQRCGPAAARQHFLERARNQSRRRVGIFDAVGPFHETSQRGQLIRHLMQVTAALAEKFRRHLTGETKHRLV